MALPFIDIHCHILPGIDDGSIDLAESLAMARMAVADGIGTIIATPHQLGNFSENRGDVIRARTAELQTALDEQNVPLTVLPGADVRIDDAMLSGLKSGNVLTLGDHRRHVLLELPHELYLPLEPVVHALAKIGMTGILSHPERNSGIHRDPDVLGPLVDAGCLMQITAGSLCGAFGTQCQLLAESMLRDGLAHFVATDAHSSRTRRPRLGEAFARVSALVGEQCAIDLFVKNTSRVAGGRAVTGGRRMETKPRWRWFNFGRAAG
jgi:protein-tyrosine phosphatase